ATAGMGRGYDQSAGGNLMSPVVSVCAAKGERAGTGFNDAAIGGSYAAVLEQLCDSNIEPGSINARAIIFDIGRSETLDKVGPRERWLERAAVEIKSAGSGGLGDFWRGKNAPIEIDNPAAGAVGHVQIA